MTEQEAIQTGIEYFRNYFPEKWRGKNLKSIVNVNDAYTEIIETVGNLDFSKLSSFVITSKHNGTGKTHIAISILKKYLLWFLQSNDRLETDDLRQYFFKEYDIYYEILESFKENSKATQREIIKKYTDPPFLIIDDLFSNRQNEFARQTILTLVDKRIDWYGLPTVITSNLSLQEISAIDNRIASRLSSGIVFEFKTKLPDYRLKK